MVVMVRVEDQGVATADPVHGAGIVVSQKRRTVIMTAAHVVRRATPPKITVEFRSMPDKKFPAQLGDSIDPDLDVAVIYVDTPDAPRVLSRDLVASLSRAPMASLVGAKVTMVGYPNDERWAHNFTPEPITKVETTRIFVPSTFVTEGLSGGGVFEAQSGALVGMVIADDRHRAVALPIAVLIERLKNWHVELELEFDVLDERLAAERDLARRGYSSTAPGLAQALAAADQDALDDFTKLALPLSIVRDALRTRATKEEPPVVQRYFEAARSSAPLQWLDAMLKRKTDPLDPTMRVPFGPTGEEAVINVAARAGNVDAVLTLLDEGASPAGYQDIRNWDVPDPRFLLPFSAVVSDQHLQVKDKLRLVDAFVAHGGVVPRVTARDESAGAHYGALSAETKVAQDQLGRIAGRRLEPTHDLCEQFPAAVCQRASALSHFDWCRVVRSVPRLFGNYSSATRDDPFVPPFIVRYFLGADTHGAYFLAEELSYYSGYALLEVDREQRQLKLLRFTNQQPLMDGPCVGGNSHYCWRQIDLTLDVRTGSYNSNYGDTLPVSSSCPRANAQAQARLAAISPRPFVHPDSRVTQCVNQVLRTPFDKMTDEATHFDILAHKTLGPRECVLARLNVELTVGNLDTMTRPHYLQGIAQDCCEKTLGYKRH
jgi:hypothetical protein